ncbi:MAG: hypothetical protein ACK4K9_07560 [Bacteroidia bacterium]
MNLGTGLLVSSLALFLASTIISFLYRSNYKLQLYCLIAMAFSNGVFITVMSSYHNWQLIIWPAIFLIRIVTLGIDIAKKIPA